MGAAELAYCTALLLAGRFGLGLDLAGLRTLAFLALVFGNQATTYANRTRRRLWSIRPSLLLLVSSAADLLIASVLARGGIGMAPLAWPVLGGTLAGAALFALGVDQLKVPLWQRLRLAQDPAGSGPPGRPPR